VAIVKGWRRAVTRVDEATVDKDDPEAVAAHQKRKDQKRAVGKGPAVMGNVWKKLTGGGKKKPAPGAEPVIDDDVHSAPLPSQQRAVVKG
jgi:hypothetical protein